MHKSLKQPCFLLYFWGEGGAFIPLLLDRTVECRQERMGGERGAGIGTRRELNSGEVEQITSWS